MLLVSSAVFLSRLNWRPSFLFCLSLHLAVLARNTLTLYWLLRHYVTLLLLLRVIAVLSPNSTTCIPTSPWRRLPLRQIPLRRLSRNFPVRGSFGEIGVMEFGLYHVEVYSFIINNNNSNNIGVFVVECSGFWIYELAVCSQRQNDERCEPVDIWTTNKLKWLRQRLRGTR